MDTGEIFSNVSNTENGLPQPLKEELIKHLRSVVHPHLFNSDSAFPSTSISLSLEQQAKKNKRTAKAMLSPRRKTYSNYTEEQKKEKEEGKEETTSEQKNPIGTTELPNEDNSQAEVKSETKEPTEQPKEENSQKGGENEEKNNEKLNTNEGDNEDGMKKEEEPTKTQEEDKPFIGAERGRSKTLSYFGMSRATYDAAKKQEQQVKEKSPQPRSSSFKTNAVASKATDVTAQQQTQSTTTTESNHTTKIEDKDKKEKEEEEETNEEFAYLRSSLPIELPEQVVKNIRIRSCFLLFFVRLFHNYSKFVAVLRRFPDPIFIFNKAKFLKKHPQEEVRKFSFLLFFLFFTLFLYFFFNLFLSFLHSRFSCFIILQSPLSLLSSFCIFLFFL